MGNLLRRHWENRIKWILNIRAGSEDVDGFIWLSTGTGNGLLWLGKDTFVFCK